MKDLTIRVFAVLLTLAIIAACIKWYGSTRYDAGYADAVTTQKAANKAALAVHEQEKITIETEAQNRIDAALAGAADAAANAGRLRGELDAISKRFGHDSATQRTCPSAAATARMLTDVLSESVSRNTALAQYADRAREAGLTCQKQYEALTNGKKHQQ